MAIQLPSSLHNDSNWLGFAICAAFSVQEYPTEFLDNLETEISHHLSCLLDMNLGGLKPLSMYIAPLKKNSSGYIYMDSFGYPIYHIGGFQIR